MACDSKVPKFYGANASVMINAIWLRQAAYA
jgi:hypothetical protein